MGSESWLRSDDDVKKGFHSEAVKLLAKDTAYIGVGTIKNLDLNAWIINPKCHSLRDADLLSAELIDWKVLWRLLSQSLSNDQGHHEGLTFSCLITLGGIERYLLSTNIHTQEFLILLTEKRACVERATFWIKRTSKCIDNHLISSSTPTGDQAI